MPKYRAAAVGGFLVAELMVVGLVSLAVFGPAAPREFVLAAPDSSLPKTLAAPNEAEVDALRALWRALHTDSYVTEWTSSPGAPGLDYRGIEDAEAGFTAYFALGDQRFRVSLTSASNPRILDFQGIPDLVRKGIRVGKLLPEVENQREGQYEVGAARYVPNSQDGGVALEFEVFWTGDIPEVGGDFCGTSYDGTSDSAAVREVETPAPLAEAARDAVVYVESSELSDFAGPPSAGCDHWRGPGLVATGPPAFVQERQSGGTREPYGDETGWVTRTMEWQGRPFVSSVWLCNASVRDDAGRVTGEGTTSVVGESLSFDSEIVVDVPVRIHPDSPARDPRLRCDLVHPENSNAFR